MIVIDSKIRLLSILGLIVIFVLFDCCIYELGFAYETYGYSNFTTTFYQQNLIKNEMARIHVGKIPQGIAINPNTNLVYVVNGDSNFISVINSSTNTVVANITSSDPKEPFRNLKQVAVNPMTNKVYAVGEGNRKIFVIDGVTNKVESIPLLNYPNDVAINQNDNTIYVTYDQRIINPKEMSFGSKGFVSVINGTDNTIIKNIQVGTSPSAIAVNPNTNRIYVANNDYSSNPYYSSSIYVLNSITNDIIDNIPTPLHPYDLTINNKTNMVYVINEDGNRVSVLNGYTNKIFDNIITKGSYSPIGIHVSSIAVNPNSNTIYTTNTGANHINILNASSHKTTLNNIAATGSILSAISVNPSNNLIYVTDQGQNIVYVLSNTTSIISRGSSNLNGNEPNIGKVGINLDEKPKDIAVDYSSNLLYIIYENSKEITTIDGSTNRKLMPFRLNTSLVDIDTNPNTHILYAIDDNSLNIIDPRANTNKILNLNGSLRSVTVNPITNRIYVTAASNDGYTGYMYVIDGIKNEIVNNIPISFPPFDGIESLSIDTNTNIIYTINGGSGLSVIDNDISKSLAANITVDTDPFARIAVNPNTDLIYVANENSRSVYVIDSYTRSTLKAIEVDGYPKSIAINPVTNLIYVANENTGFVSVINGTDNTIIKNIQVGTSPSAIAVNPNTNRIYVANSDSNTISIIDGIANKMIAGVTFDINPSNAGYIVCGNSTSSSPTKQYSYVFVGDSCMAKPNKDFEFFSWQENLKDNSTQSLQVALAPSIFDSIMDFFHMKPDKAEATLAITKFGNFTANFKELPPPLPTEYLLGLYTLAATVFTGWFVPNIARYINTTMQKRHMLTYFIKLDELKNSNERNNKLEYMRKEIIKSFAKGAISESHYKLLIEKIAEIEK